MSEPLLSVQNIKRHFSAGGGMFRKTRRAVKAVDGVSFAIGQGETLGLVGESGCGKSTTGRMIVGLLAPTDGEIFFQGQSIAEKTIRRNAGKNLQMVFQDPYASLNPRMVIRQIVAEPLLLQNWGSRAERDKRVDELLERVGLASYHASRYPDEFSGGQRQRIGIARALALSPKLIVCDEPISALDVSIQAQILNLLTDIQQDLGISYLFISHGLQAVKYVSHKIAVMYLGKIVEQAEGDSLFSNPLHPYTKALLSAVPEPDPSRRERERIVLSGDLPSPSNPPKGCRFHTRCPTAMERCKTEEPTPLTVAEDRQIACFLYE
ncbi:ABC transporter ATP-binding protein [Effusibacillus dendaii]|uniref:ABC transporter ATP-binding protein n=1 Tax=Effusibacillus dendaii TaxID=2743772 RepID=A0A7I8DC77_9BACL|nr:dipeptide ABC transporter ATP-binding protein [Effusibacillus dendaii]BCJ85521.1 ABC transporter ATP-binding protein [Effusibacillus dendaii]